MFDFLILGEVRGRARKVRISAKNFAEIGGHGSAVRLGDPQVANAANTISHQGHAGLPSFLIASNRGNLGLESMATHASEKQQLFAGTLRQQSLPFMNGKIGPTDLRLLERDI